MNSFRLRVLALGAIVLSCLNVAGAAVSTQTLASQEATIAALKSQAVQAVAAQNLAEGEVKRIRHNSERLLKMYPLQARRVAAVLKDLEAHKYRPLIDSQVYRTAKQQADLVKRGHSTVYYSFHNVTGKNGKAESLAADVVLFDPKTQSSTWTVPRAFWLKLHSSALAHSSTTGIAWGLSKNNRQRLALAVADQEWGYGGLLGWDTAHVEPRHVTIAQAKKGMRPQ